MNSKESIEQLKRLQKLEIHSTRLLGGWLPGIEKWEIKHAVALHLWQDAQHSKELRTRLWELRIPSPDRSMRGNPDRIAEALSLSQSDYEFLTAHYFVFKKLIVEAYRNIVEQTHEVYDAPTISMVERILPEKTAQVEWAEQQLAPLLDTEEKEQQARRWKTYLHAVIESDGGIGGASSPAEKSGAPAPPPATHLSPLPFATAKRDLRFNIHFSGIPLPDEEDFEGQRLYQFVNYAHEMQAAETLGSILWEVTGMEWEFYFDLARHCYDEARHTSLGESRLKELGHTVFDFPHCVTNYNWRQLYDPLTRYCILTYVIESDSFKYKHATYQKYLQEGDNESAEAILYDITDETLHVRWGQKWVPKLMELQGVDQPIETLVVEGRSILLKHCVTPVQKKFSNLASKGNG